MKRTLIALMFVGCATASQQVDTGRADAAHPAATGANDQAVVAAGWHVNKEHCCSEPDGSDGAAQCSERAKTDSSCRYTQALICRGIDVDDETKRREREESEKCLPTCECICRAEDARCMSVP